MSERKNKLGHQAPEKTGPRGLGGYCWAEHAPTHLHCTKPVGHAGAHWHAYRKRSW